MTQVNIHEAKTHLSRLVASIKDGRETEVVIAQNGVPAARLVAIKDKRKRALWEAAKGRWTIAGNIDVQNPEIAKLFDEGSD